MSNNKSRIDLPNGSYADSVVIVDPSTGLASSRVRTEDGSKAFQAGKEFRVILEVIKPANDTWTIRFINPVPIVLIAVNIMLDNGAVRYSTLSSPVFTGTYTAKIPLNQNRMLAIPPAALSTFEYNTGPAVGATGTGENDIMRVRAGNGSKNSTQNSFAHRGLSAGSHAIVMAPITGANDTNQVNGTIELIWSELPDEYTA